MSKMIFIVMFAALSITAAAQDSSTQKISDSLTRASAKKNYLTMDSGKLIVVIGDSHKMATASQSLGNGIVVRPNGAVFLKDGGTATLKDGDKIFFDGTIARKNDIKGIKEIKK